MNGSYIVLTGTLLFLLGCLLNTARGHHFDYDPCSPFGPDHWADSYPACGGRQQSPINIVTSQVAYGKDYRVSHSPPLSTDAFGLLENKGHTIEFSLYDDELFTLRGVPKANLSQPYRLTQLHFHFGSDDQHGSEHTVDGEAAAGQIHFVHYNLRYSGFEEAQNHPDGLAVISVRLQPVAGTRNRALDHMMQNIHNIQHVGSQVNVEINLDELIPSCERFYTYFGSLTTPGCFESVTWIIMRDTVAISRLDLQLLRRLRGSDGELVSEQGNFRPIQRRNGRVVEANFMPKCFGRKKLANGRKRLANRTNSPRMLFIS